MKIITQREYAEANLRLEELLKQIREDTIENSAFSKELIQLSNIVEQYEEKHFPIESPTLKEMIELRMFEMGLKRKDLTKLLNTSPSRISEYLNGKREITLKIAKSLHKKLNIDGDLILK